MKLLSKIIGQCPSEMPTEDYLALIKQNRARIRKEIKEYHKLKRAIAAESTVTKPRGRPKGAKPARIDKKQIQIMEMIKTAGLTQEEAELLFSELKEKK